MIPEQSELLSCFEDVDQFSEAAFKVIELRKDDCLVEEELVGSWVLCFLLDQPILLLIALIQIDTGLHDLR